MPTYAIGDLQGCFKPLTQLLEKIEFNATQDRLWFTGDLVNRGPQSLEVLRFVKSLGPNHITVLGNHDLHLLALANGARTKNFDALQDVLTAPDKIELMEWIATLPLFHYDATLNYALVHAGIAPHWTLQNTANYAREVETVLKSDALPRFLKHMYGNHPDQWKDDLEGDERLRVITNYLTRVRYCYPDGRMDFRYDGPINNAPSPLLPWYELPSRKTQSDRIIFGHWASLVGNVSVKNIYALDTGCVWGNCLTAMRLEDGKRFSVKCETFATFAPSE